MKKEKIPASPPAVKASVKAKAAKKAGKPGPKPGERQRLLDSIDALAARLSKLEETKLDAAKEKVVTDFVAKRAETVAVGRIVLYEGHNPGSIRPAVICRVWDEYCVNLRVLSDGANDMLSTEWITSAVRSSLVGGQIGPRQWAFPSEYADATKLLINNPALMTSDERRALGIDEASK